MEAESKEIVPTGIEDKPQAQAAGGGMMTATMTTKKVGEGTGRRHYVARAQQLSAAPGPVKPAGATGYGSFSACDALPS